MRLPADGKGFVVWKEHLELSMWAQGLYGYLDGTITKPANLPSLPAGAAALIAEQVGIVEKYTKDLNQYLQKQAIVFQQISLTIPNSLYLKMKGKPTIKEAWDALKSDFERRLCMITIKLQKCLQDTRCAESGNICTHFDNIQIMWEEHASLGTNISEQDFSATILRSLPKSYDQFILAITATASVLKQELNPDNLIQMIINKYNHQLTRPGAKEEEEKGTEAVFFAGNNWGKPEMRSDKDIECYNCHKKGHKKAEC